jgi:hypothetical protein
LNLCSGTLTRWKELQRVPQSYEFDLLVLSHCIIDYSLYTSRQKDQFFNPINTAKNCFDLFYNEIKKMDEDYKDFTYIEPSAGDGSFLRVLPENSISMDIDPKHDSIVEYYYLNWKPQRSDNKFVVFGNPPFGLRGHIKHSTNFAD